MDISLKVDVLLEKEWIGRQLGEAAVVPASWLLWMVGRRAIDMQHNA